jgi:hypothetical protein
MRGIVLFVRTIQISVSIQENPTEFLDLFNRQKDCARFKISHEQAFIV